MHQYTRIMYIAYKYSIIYYYMQTISDKFVDGCRDIIYIICQKCLEFLLRKKRV